MTQVNISPKDVMKLRQKTGLGMMDCKKALEETNGDIKAAEEWLREKLKGKMDTRTERATAEGRVAIAAQDSRAVILEIRSESDFTARNDRFVKMVEDVARLALELPAGPVKPTPEITECIDDVRITTGENVNFARGEKLEGGRFGSYIHHDAKRGALLQVEGDVDEETLKGICQHIVAHVPPPVAVSKDDVPADQLAKVRAEAEKEAAESGKPAEIAQKIAEGKVRKYLEENTLLDQKFIRDETKSIRDLLPGGAKIVRFVRYTVGAGDDE